MIGFVFWRSISLGGFYRLRWLRPFELSRRTFLVLGSIWGPGGGWGAARSSSDKSVPHLRRSGEGAPESPRPDRGGAGAAT